MSGQRLARRSLLLAAGGMACLRAGAAGSTDRVLDASLHPYVPEPAQPGAEAGWLTPDGAIRIGGAEHVEFIVRRFNALYARTHPGTRFVFESKGTTSAVPLLMFDKTLFGAMGREINPVERVPYRKIVGTDPLEIRVAHTSDDTSQHLATSLAVYVHRSNPLAGISLEQMARVFAVGNAGGDYSHWGQLGLGGEWAVRAIHPYGTPEYTGFGNYLQARQLQRLPLNPRHEFHGGTGELLRRLGSDPGGIVVAAIGREDAQVKQLALVGPDGAATTGTPAEVASGRYGLGRPLFFYVRRQKGQPLDPVVREYLRLVLSREGQQIVASQPRGYLPLAEADAARERAKLEAAA